MIKTRKEFRTMDSNKNSAQLLMSRELNEDVRLRLRNAFLMRRSLVDRLGLHAELDGHTGCVNCLEWSHSAELLASGSDDSQAIIWDPFRKKKLHTIETGHGGNIFSVKFLPQSGDRLIATAAGDGNVYVHRIGSAEKALSCSCHTSRVKRLATSPETPYLFWSCGEDGLILQHDLRTSHECSSGPSNILINLLTHAGKNSEIKCVAVHPTQSNYMAVGANDPFVRIYDRRMIKTTSISYRAGRLESNFSRYNYIMTNSRSEELKDAIPLDCAQYFVPGHLPRKLPDYRRRFRSLATTDVTFDPSGRYLLANIGGEHVYLFDWTNAQPPVAMNVHSATSEESTRANGLISNPVIPGSALPPAVDALKARANAAFEQHDFSRAIVLYSRAINMCPKAAVLYSNRAAAFMQRDWDGDIYAALKDCQMAVKLDPNYAKADFRYVRCLYELGWVSAAHERLQSLKAKYPDHAAHRALERDVQTALQKQRHQSSGEAASSDERGEQMPASRRLLSEAEIYWRNAALDYSERFCGHCNTTTDIKEANFLGGNSEYVVAGSDDGCFFIWERCTGEIVRILRADESIVNCLQPHPSVALLASSGIDSLVRLWSPLPEDGLKNDRVIDDIETAAKANQNRMNADPFEQILFNMGFGAAEGEEMAGRHLRRNRGAAAPAARPNMEADNSDEDDAEPQASVQCRPS